MMKFARFFITCFISALHLHSHGETVVSFYEGDSTRELYDKALLKLVLEKTKPTHGDYVLNPQPSVPGPRRVLALHQNAIPNLVMVRSYSNDPSHLTLRNVHFPVDLGALGWRICFIHKDNREKLAAIKNLEQLKKFSIIQGASWSDNTILRANGFNVIELVEYSNLLKMIATKRAALFCRGVNELPNELPQAAVLPNITYDESFTLVYKMPLFFYLNKQSESLAVRLEKGIEIAYKDGSLYNLWLEHFRSAVIFSKFNQRRIFTLENPDLVGLNNDYEKYLIDLRTLE